MNDANKLWIRAQKNITSNNITLAIQQLDKAIVLEPKNPYYASERGVAYFLRGNHEQALKELTRAIQLEPDYGYRYASRAYVLGAMKRTQEAIADYQKCVELDPEDAIAHNNLGILLESAGKASSAKKSFKKADTLEQAVQDRGIVVPKNDIPAEQTFNSKNKAKKQPPRQKITKNKSVWGVFKKVITKKSVFLEYLNFLRSLFEKRKPDQ